MPPGLTTRLPVCVELEWRRAGEVRLKHAKLKFPPVPPIPAVYRFWLDDQTGRSVYIGQAVLLDQRFAWHRAGHGSQRTSFPMNGRMRNVPEGGGTVSVEITTEITLIVDGTPSASDLRSGFVRRLAENAALVAAEAAGQRPSRTGSRTRIRPQRPTPPAPPRCAVTAPITTSGANRLQERNDGSQPATRCPTLSCPVLLMFVVSALGCVLL
jgi:hypothetical protein